MNNMHRTILLSLLTLVTCTAQAATFSLNAEQSALNFVSIKAGDVAEAHRFGSLSGSIDEAGLATVSIDLASVDTAIEVRDERMRTILFDVESYPVARVSVVAQALMPAESGETRQGMVNLNVELHGASGVVQATVNVRRLATGGLEVVSERPILVHAAQFGLASGVQQLQDIAGLPSISLAVPVTFRLVFTED